MADPVAHPFYFAMAEHEDTPFDDVYHAVMEFYIFSFTLEQAETEFASLSIEIENPGIPGLLAPGRPLWCWFSWFNGTSIVPLFHGRLVAVPTNLLATVITLKFVARPENYEEQRAGIAQQVRDYGAPFWDEIFIDEAHRQDTDVVLEALPSDWHTDRVDQVVSITDILVGEDGTITFNSGEAYLDDLDVQIAETPIQAVAVEGTVPWRQTHGGTFNLGQWVWSGVGASGVAKGWPKAGDGFSGGYNCAGSVAIVTVIAPEPVTWQIQYQNTKKEHRNGDTMSIQEHYSGLSGGQLHIDKYNITIGDPDDGTPAHTEVEASGSQIWANGGAITGMSLGYGADRDRNEKLSFTVRSDLQEVLRSNLDEEVPEKISKSGTSVQDAIGNPSLPSYFMTPRGDVSVRYLIMLAVARLRLGARIVQATWGTTFEKGVLLTLRKNAALFDPRLQHGQIVGKITRYVLEGNGDSNEFKGTVQIGAAIGLGNAITEAEGNPTYCDADYVGNDYQMYENQIIAIGNNDIAYSPPIIVPNDDGLIFPLTASQVVVSISQHQNQIKPGTEDDDVLVDSGGDAAPTLGRYGRPLYVDYKAIREKETQRQAKQLGKLSSWLEVKLKSLEGQAFGSAATVDVQNLVLPKQYDVSSP
jgi:hypothetical protein